MINYFLERWKRWQHHSGLKQTYFVLGGIASVFLIGLLIILSIKFIEKINDETTFRDIAIALFATLSGLGVLFGFYTSIIRTETAEQGLITDRLNKAVEGLGKNKENNKPVIEVRIGALLALERIAQDSIRDHIQIMEILCAYIQENSPITGKEVEIDTINKAKPLRKDIQATLNIIGRRNKWQGGKKRLKTEAKQKYYINLSYCNLQGADITDANLSRANFDGTILSDARFLRTDLSATTFRKTNLNNADFQMSDMNGSYIYGADMGNAVFMNIKLTGNALIILINMSNVTFSTVDIADSAIHHCFAYKGDFSYFINLTQMQLNEMFLGKDIKIPEGLIHPQKGTEYDQVYDTFDDFMAAYECWNKRFGLFPLNKSEIHAFITP